MYAHDFERVVLGSVLVNPKNWHLIAVLRVGDFSIDSHRKIFECMRALAESSRPIDLITLVLELDCHRQLQVVGDVGYVSSLTEGLPDRPFESVKHYVDEVRRLAGLRQVAHTANSIREQANNPAAKIADLRNRLLEAEREAIRYEVSSGSRITRIEDIPDPIALPSEEVEWVVHGLIPARGITIIAGEAGAGKTWLALALARAMTWGGDFLDRRTRNASMLYLDRENPLSLVQDRLHVLFGGASEFRPWGLWCPDEPPMIGDPRLVEFARNGPVLVVDSMIRFHRADENSATHMAPVMASLRALATAGASVIVLHHKPKGDTSSYRGSSDIVAGADAAFALTKRDDLLELRTVKNRFATDVTIKMRADFAAGTFVVVDSPGLKGRSAVDRLEDIIRTSPGLTQNEILKRAGMNRQRAITLLQHHAGKLWHQERGAKRSSRYFPLRMVPEKFCEKAIRNRLASGSESSSNHDSGWREPLRTTQVVPVLPPFRGGNREQPAYHGA